MVSKGKVLEWLKRHAWKACNRQNRFAGSNPVLSAMFLAITSFFNVFMKKTILSFALVWMMVMACMAGQQTIPSDEAKGTPHTVSVADSNAAEVVTAADSAAVESIGDNDLALPDEAADDSADQSLHKVIKSKFIEGNAGFMSLVALALVLGLAFCIERIIYLSLSEINAKKLMEEIESKVNIGDIEGAKELCRNTRGPVASICCQGLMRISESIDNIERSIISYGSVQTANLEKGCSWISLFITIAPSLGFLGTVIGMVMAFDQIRIAGDINPTIVASGMKVALITTIFGIVVAIVLQLFYNYIISKIEHLTSQMEESTVTLLDIIVKYKSSR